MSATYDAVVVGGGPAGLTAAIYLGRFRRRVLVIDGGRSRLGWIARSHNHPGFPDGVVGKTLLADMRAQAERYGAEIRGGHARAAHKDGASFRIDTDEGAVCAPYVIAATGVTDNPIALPDVFDAVQRGLIRMCPICDGYEVIDHAVGVLGAGRKGIDEARFLLTYTPRVTLIHVGAPGDLAAQDRSDLRAAGIDLVETPIGQVHIEQEAIRAFDFGDGDLRRFDSIYSALGTTPSNDLAIQLGARSDADGCLKVDEHQQTTIDGFYAAGDVVRGLNQISIAQGEGALAATDIHNRLRRAGL